MSPLRTMIDKLKALLSGPGPGGGVALGDAVKVANARAEILQTTPTRWFDPAGAVHGVSSLPKDWTREKAWADGWRPDPTSYVDNDPYRKKHGRLEHAYNVKINAGFVQLMAAVYSTQGTASGFKYVALSNDAVTETATSTTLSTEIAANGLARAIATYAQTSGVTPWSLTQTITFTCATSSQACQKAALFDAAAAGNMNHVLGFTQRTLQVGDQIQITFTITIS